MTRIEKLTDVILQNSIKNIIDLRKFLEQNYDEFKISTKEMNRTISANVDYFSLYFESNQ